VKNLFSWFANPKTHGLPKSRFAELGRLVDSLNRQSRCKSAMSYIMRVLDYEPDNRDVLDLARLTAWCCTRVHHSCREPLSVIQINDHRLDHFFNECGSHQCFYQWIPTRSVVKSWYSHGALIGTGGATGSPGYCRYCKKAFCVEHVKDPLPTIEFSSNPHCPLCGHELDCEYAQGRKARQAPRLNKKLSGVVLVRDGFIPPDKEYCLKVFQHSSSDVLEDLPNTIGMNLHPWEYDAKPVLNKVTSYLEKQMQRKYPADQIAIWTGLDTGTNTNFHLIKIWETSPKVTLDNLFDIPDYSEDFPYQTAELLNAGAQKDDAGAKPFAPASPDLAKTQKEPVPKIKQGCLSISLVESSRLGDAGFGGGSFQEAIRNMNDRNDAAAMHCFEEALRRGLDPLRQGYVHAQLGEIYLRANDISKALDEFTKVLDFKEAIYDSIHNAVQYLEVIYGELGRTESVDLLKQLKSKTSSKINYSLSAATIDRVLQLTIKNKPRFRD
jgi:hypothetical protein